MNVDAWGHIDTLLTVILFLFADISNVLKELLQVQKENLSIEREKLEIEKQRLEYERVVGTQLVTLVPMIGGLIQRVALSANQGLLSFVGKGQKRKANGDDTDIFKDSKILRSVLEQGIKKYMMEDFDETNEKEHNSENENSDNENGEAKSEENSNSSVK